VPDQASSSYNFTSQEEGKGGGVSSVDKRGKEKGEERSGLPILLFLCRSGGGDKEIGKGRKGERMAAIVSLFSFYLLQVLSEGRRKVQRVIGRREEEDRKKKRATTCSLSTSLLRFS